MVISVFQGGILMHRRFIEAEHNGTRYVDRIVVPESYRNEILRVAHTIPLSGHMGFAKTLDRIVYPVMFENFVLRAHNVNW